jgi:hypothetical protein
MPAPRRLSRGIVASRIGPQAVDDDDQMRVARLPDGGVNRQVDRHDGKEDKDESSKLFHTLQLRRPG